MKVYLKILTVFLWTGYCMTMGCKKSDVQALKVDNSKPPLAIVPRNQLIPEQMGTGKTKMTYSYSADYSLCKIVYGDGTSTELEFTADGKPSYLTHYAGDDPTSLTQYKMDTKGQIISGTTYKITEDTYQMLRIFKILYKSDAQINTISYYDQHETLTKIEKWLYAENGNLIKTQNNDGLITADFSYDDKNGLFKHVKYAWLFAIEEQNNLFQSGQNNISSCSYPSAVTRNQKISYTYNKDNYPENITSEVRAEKLSYKVTYKKLN
jgi:hypothetical protein